MVDEVKTVEVKTETKPEMSSLDILTELRGEREKMEKARDEMKKIAQEQNEINTRIVMGGTARAGTAQVTPKTKEQLIKEKAEAEAESVVKRMFGRR